MVLKYAILSFLSWRPLTGYELKKMFSESIFIYWSGNNNQIYTTLMQLHHEELVTVEVQHQEKSPSRKIYTITDKGLAQLKEWLSSTPELPQLRSAFLIQLAWADLLSPQELDSVLGRYEHEVEMQVLMCREQKRRNRINPSRSERETYIWHEISEHWIDSFAQELSWVKKVRSNLSAGKFTGSNNPSPQE